MSWKLKMCDRCGESPATYFVDIPTCPLMVLCKACALLLRLLGPDPRVDSTIGGR